ncbi:hypothetical protein Hc94105_1322 [Helicobacter cinaedi]|uniref:phosphatase PAP2 family protein n=1 Tax=Helicobacter cinaedi TaxID=213 RepID=UPI001F3D9DFD|nr:phosphatase PAP2 family protein [Helicobacter cinaedi]BDB67107.1 hypothetical protein Hc94105_1322 [Helicobacter cinaedi]
MYKKILMTLVLCIGLQKGLYAQKSGFEIYGDVMQILPFMMMAYSYAIDDLQGVKEQAIGAGATFLTTHAIKQGFVIVSRSNESYARISQRPNNGSFDGFPSGHTSFTFSAAGFAQKRYGWKWGVPLSLIGASVGASRVYAERHTTTQVIAGAILGFSLSYFLASKQSKDSQLTAWVDNAENGTQNYHIGYIKRF